MANPQRPEDGHAASPNAGRNAAVALSYDEADGAPRVVAKGYGQLADTIVRTAEENGLYVHESRELVGLLMQVDLTRIFLPNCTLRWQNCWPGCIAWNRARFRPTPRRPIYLSKESPPCWTPAIRNFCSPGRKTCVPRCSSSPTPTATSWCATPPIARSPCSSWGRHTRQFFWRPRDYAGADFEQSDSMGLLSGTTFHFHATAYGACRSASGCSGPT